MKPVGPARIDLRKILLLGFEHDIYAEIFHNAEESMNYLRLAERNNEIDYDTYQEYKATIEEELDEANSIRFSLATVDNRIKQIRRMNPELRRDIDQRARSTNRKLHAILYEILDSDSQDLTEQVDSINVLRNHFITSLRLRLQLSWAWDVILNIHREISMKRVIHYSHVITEIAMQLNDETIITKVRSILSALEINSDPWYKHITLPGTISQLKARMNQQIELLEQLQTQVKPCINKRKTPSVKENHKKNGTYQIEDPLSILKFPVRPGESHTKDSFLLLCQH